MIIRKDTTKARRADKTTGRGAAPAPLACYRRDARTPARLCRQFEIFAEVSGAGANGVEIFAEVSGAGLNGVEGADEDSEWVPTA